MSTDKRSVATDALETLGTIIDTNTGRDAIHLAVEPAIAAHTLRPGEDVGFIGKEVGVCDNPVGIVDPFLKGAVTKGQMFWLVVYPRKITSLRHVWTHPDFSEESKPTEISREETFAGDPVAFSKSWIDGFAREIDQNVNRLMDAADKWMEDDYYTYDNSESYKAHWDKFPEFWTHYAVIRGVDVPEGKRESFFTCSC